MVGLPSTVKQDSLEHYNFERLFQHIDVNNDREMSWPEFVAVFGKDVAPPQVPGAHCGDSAD